MLRRKPRARMPDLEAEAFGDIEGFAAAAGAGQ
jgi:hypothetical protein